MGAEDAAPRRAQVVVMGDFGRSPRMQYHALSLAQQVRLLSACAEGAASRVFTLSALALPLAPSRPLSVAQKKHVRLGMRVQAGMEVDVVAFEGSTPIALLTQEPHVHLRLISPPCAPFTTTPPTSTACSWT
jgi:beta-1,4-mannosyltransferase